jgi:hypothetical protein
LRTAAAGVDYCVWLIGSGANGGAIMAKFMELTLENTTQVVTINADKVVKFWQPNGYNYTIIEFVAGSSVSVKESPTDIWNMGMS